MSSIAWLSTKLEDGRIACEACNQLWYGRFHPNVTNHLINKNSCPSCGYKLHGVWQ